MWAQCVFNPVPSDLAHTHDFQTMEGLAGGFQSPRASTVVTPQPWDGKADTAACVVSFMNEGLQGTGSITQYWNTGRTCKTHPKTHTKTQTKTQTEPRRGSRAYAHTPPDSPKHTPSHTNRNTTILQYYDTTVVLYY